MRKIIISKFDQIISIENLLEAWEEFIEDKKNRQDIKLFSQNLVQNIT
ncbi:MAG: hypothetical protein NTY30_01390 [Candidatus Berkelbacteria bacterium]|nr:hypothetical protein [Candidatus Berkelbacteria bacterium]